MEIISHRGYWKSEDEKNTAIAFERSFSMGFGTETDVRDYQGELVISHDIPESRGMTLDEFFQLYLKYDHSLPLALNIKSDGLQLKLKAKLDAYQIQNYFVFDMSVPDALHYLRHGLRAYTRESEYEQSPSFYEQAAGVWLDSFKSDWIDDQTLDKHLRQGKKICIVSPDLHKRPFETKWSEYLKMDSVINSADVMLCTDYPESAREVFCE